MAMTDEHAATGRPMKTTTFLSAIFGTLSVVMLIKHGFAVSFVSSLQIVLNFYDQAMQVLFGWAEPWIKQELAALRDWIGWNLQLYPHWKYIFVLISIYFIRGVPGELYKSLTWDRGKELADHKRFKLLTRNAGTAYILQQLLFGSLR